jgi:predicted RNA-binding protein YlqC (UPF0109 family)
MEELLKYIISNIVSDPAELKIETENIGDDIYYYIMVPENERGIIIGKEGKNIKSIRNLMSIIAKKQNKRVFVKIRD